MNSWILQGNPDQFDIDKYMSTADVIYWSIKYPKHEQLMKKGDQVFFWRSKGKSNNLYGIVAYGIIITEPIDRNLISEEIQKYDNLWKGSHQEKSKIKVGVKIIDFRLTEDAGMITSDDFSKDEILRNSAIIKSRIGTVFHLSNNEFKRISEYWNEVSPSNQIHESYEYSVYEGNPKLRKHIIRERNKTLRNIAISNFLKKNGSIFCEICGFNFEKTYGELGKDYIEVHHFEPLSKRKENKKSQVSDLKLLCSNCHRIVHRGDPIENYQSLKTILKPNFYSV